MIEELIKDYIAGEGNRDQVMYRIAREYHKIFQTASATTFYFKVARNNRNELGYECLLQIGECLSSQGNREGTVRNMYYHAVDMLPNRPEAYYLLSKNWQFVGDGQTAYTFIKHALRLKSVKNLKTLKEANSKINHYIQAIICSWNWGKPNEAREFYNKINQDKLTIAQKLDLKEIKEFLLP